MNDLSVAEVIDSIEPGSMEDSAEFILGYLIGALDLSDTRQALERWRDRRAASRSAVTA